MFSENFNLMLERFTLKIMLLTESAHANKLCKSSGQSDLGLDQTEPSLICLKTLFWTFRTFEPITGS